MPYIRKTIKHGNIIEVCKYTNGRYCRKGQNAPAVRETPKEQVAWQENNDIRKVWRLLDNNFGSGDLWVTLTYPARARPSADEVRGNMQEFMKRLRRLYKKAGQLCKYVYSVGRGKRGAAHIHMVLSKFDIEQIRDLWARIVNGGAWVRTDFQPLHKHKDYHKLASYIIKNSAEDWASPDPVFKKRYCSSRNLTPEWKKEPPEKPGYYIDKERSYQGFTSYGYPIQYTVYVKLEGRRPDEFAEGRGAPWKILQEQGEETLRGLQNRILQI